MVRERAAALVLYNAWERRQAARDDRDDGNLAARLDWLREAYDLVKNLGALRQSRRLPLRAEAEVPEKQGRCEPALGRGFPPARQDPRPGGCLLPQCYRSAHRAAAGFLAEIASKYPGAGPHLRAAARCFAVEADLLDQGGSLLGWQSPEGPDPERNQRAAELLAQACGQYERGIGEIGAAVGFLE